MPLKTQENNELSDLCSAMNAVFTGFVGFPQLYPSETKTPPNAKVIAPSLTTTLYFHTEFLGIILFMLIVKNNGWFFMS